MHTDFLKEPIGNSVDEKLEFCSKALELLAELKNIPDNHPFI